VAPSVVLMQQQAYFELRTCGIADTLLKCLVSSIENFWVAAVVAETLCFVWWRRPDHPRIEITFRRPDAHPRDICGRWVLLFRSAQNSATRFMSYEARSPSGKAKVCKTFIGGSIPPRASNVFGLERSAVRTFLIRTRTAVCLSNSFYSLVQ
jgi:hypothetical protein